MEFSLEKDVLKFTWDEVAELGEKISVRIITGSMTLMDLSKMERAIIEFYHAHYGGARGYDESNYKEYLQTEHWRRFRLLALDHYTYKCMACGAIYKPLEVHHNNYDCLGKEKYNDVIPLCADCHAVFHDARGELTKI
jgi:hypothetical protein